MIRRQVTAEGQRVASGRKLYLRLRMVAICSALWLLSTSGAQAQISDELADVYRQIIEHIDTDLKTKFQRALEEETDLIQFTPDQFRRFRDHPINPFDSLLDIDPNELDGAIELKFELPCLRTRPTHPAERQHASLLESVRGVPQRASRSTVSVVREGKIIAMGTVVNDRGTILTKASELAIAEQPVAAGSRIRVMSTANRVGWGIVRRIDHENDLAVVDTDLKDLVPIVWSHRQPEMGEFVVTGDAGGKVLAIGTFSHSPRNVLGSEQAYLGIQPIAAAEGIRVVEVTPDSSAAKAGIRAGDIVRRLNGKSIADVASLVAEIRHQRPGSVVLLDIVREGKAFTTRVELAGRKTPADRAARFLMMNRLGAIPSKRCSDFRCVFQHDTPLFPEHCGGPVVDLEGNAIGINIARQGRVSSLAIPASFLEEILPELLREDVAAKR